MQSLRSDGSFNRYEGIVAAVQDAALDAARWPRASALIDDACAMHCNHLAVIATGGAAPEYRYGWFLSHGAPLPELERDYVERYFPTDERVARLLMLPSGCLLHNTAVYTERERAVSATYNRFLPRWDGRNQWNVRLDGPDGLHVIWTATRLGSQGAWRRSHADLLKSLLLHVRHMVRVRHALLDARRS